ncbi:hypothetical protein BCR34DRAFT_145047 [Clohesyomyces aquaticus]|uniref:Uncharacterized protein n=1 Tax=Clohesyomyces aquaticus TaxID=1231657 RepID=A0A1Y2A0G3_9PLEO|nr:hypothetical protein BCR34DRAFT_145047 [Clohesyomyces aquaticus]
MCGVCYSWTPLALYEDDDDGALPILKNTSRRTWPLADLLLLSFNKSLSSADMSVLLDRLPKFSPATFYVFLGFELLIPHSVEYKGERPTQSKSVHGLFAGSDKNLPKNKNCRCQKIMPFFWTSLAQAAARSTVRTTVRLARIQPVPSQFVSTYGR